MGDIPEEGLKTSGTELTEEPKMQNIEGGETEVKPADEGLQNHVAEKPLESKKEIKTKGFSPVVTIVFSAVSLVAIVVLAILLFLQMYDTNKYIALSDSYKGKLQTAEHNNSILRDENSGLSDRGKELTSDLSTANEKNDQIQADLDKKKAEVAQINNQLSSKRAELGKAERGLAKFNDLNKLFGDFDNDTYTYTSLVNDAYQSILDGNADGLQKNLNKMKETYPKITKEEQDISNIFEKIQSGSY